MSRCTYFLGAHLSSRYRCVLPVDANGEHPGKQHVGITPAARLSIQAFLAGTEYAKYDPSPAAREAMRLYAPDVPFDEIPFEHLQEQSLAEAIASLKPGEVLRTTI